MAMLALAEPAAYVVSASQLADMPHDVPLLSSAMVNVVCVPPLLPGTSATLLSTHAPVTEIVAYVLALVVATTLNMLPPVALAGSGWLPAWVMLVVGGSSVRGLTPTVNPYAAISPTIGLVPGWVTVEVASWPSVAYA
jgi:hypothetical protein